MLIKVAWFLFGMIVGALATMMCAVLYDSYESHRKEKRMRNIPRKYKSVLLQHGLNPSQWLLAVETESHLSLVNKEDASLRRCIKKH